MPSRGWAFWIVVGLAWLGVLFWFGLPAHDFSEPSKRICIYIAQVISGNWSADMRGKIPQWIFVFGTLIAILLNVLTVSAIIGLFIRIFGKRSPAMDVITAFDLRSSDIKDELITRLKKRFGEDAVNEINSAFEDGDMTWRNSTLPDFLGASGARKFLEKVERADVAEDRPVGRHSNPAAR